MLFNNPHIILVNVVQGSELSGWAEGRYSFEGIDLNHNFPDLNNIMWDTEEKAADKSKVPNHYIPIPEYYTKEDPTVRKCILFVHLKNSFHWHHLEAILTLTGNRN